MTFKDWMEKKGLTPEEMAEEIKTRGHETTADMVRKVRRGERRFSPEINREIVSWSKGRVSWEELNFPEEFRQASGA